jgi:hypothetical protein
MPDMVLSVDGTATVPRFVAGNALTGSNYMNIVGRPQPDGKWFWGKGSSLMGTIPSAQRPSLPFYLPMTVPVTFAGQPMWLHHVAVRFATEPAKSYVDQISVWDGGKIAFQTPASLDLDGGFRGGPVEGQNGFSLPQSHQLASNLLIEFAVKFVSDGAHVVFSGATATLKDHA